MSDMTATAQYEDAPAMSAPIISPETASAICAVMGKAETLKKSDKNTYDNYNFTSVDKFFEFVNPLCAEAGLFFLHQEIGYDYYENKKQSLWVRVRFAFYVCHTSGDVCGPFPRCVAVPMNGAQAYGSAQSYALKQFLRGLFLIPTGDKDDADLNATDKEQREPVTRTLPSTRPFKTQPASENNPPNRDDPFGATDEDISRETAHIATITNMDELASYWGALQKAQISVARHPDIIAAKENQKAAIDASAS